MNEFLTKWITMVNHSWAKLQEKWNKTASSWDVIEYLTNKYIYKKDKFV